MNREKLIVTVLITGAAVLGVVDLAHAAKKPKGQDLYKEYCKRCHEADSPNGEYTPMTLIQEQWERFFAKKYEAVHTGVVDENHEGKKVTDAISAEDLAQIKKFAVDHAADSEHPMTCG